MTEKQKEDIKEDVEKVEELQTNSIFEKNSSVPIFDQNISVQVNVTDMTYLLKLLKWKPENEWDCETKLNSIFPNPANVDHQSTTKEVQSTTFGLQ